VPGYASDSWWGRCDRGMPLVPASRQDRVNFKE
jgi:hypothetical protein